MSSCAGIAARVTCTRLLFARANVGEVDRRPDGVTRDGANDVLAAEDAIGRDAKDAIAFSKAGFLGGRAAHDVPDANALPRLVGVHGDAQPRTSLDRLRRGVRGDQDGEPGGADAPERRQKQRRQAPTQRPTRHAFSMGARRRVMTSSASARAACSATKRRSAPSAAGRCAPRKGQRSWPSSGSYKGARKEKSKPSKAG